MALLERYLDAVGRHLPPDQEQDILAELRDDIQATYDRRAAELGRPLTDEDEADLLKRYGRPLMMASRYRPERHLVGPGWFPFYWNALKVALAVALAVTIGLPVVLALAGRSPGAIIRALFHFPETAVRVFAWVTIGFAVLETATSSPQWRNSWDPRRLPALRPTGLPRPSRFVIAFDLGATAAFLAWWIAVHRNPELLFLPPMVGLGAWWSSLYLPLLGLLLVSMAVKSMLVLRPDWTGLRLAAGLVTTAAGVAIGLFVLRADVLVTGSGASGVKLAQLLEMMLRWSVTIGIVVAVTATAFDGWRYVRAGPR